MINVKSQWDFASIFGSKDEKMNQGLGPDFPAISSVLIDSS
jgi:hypothetical protein